MSGGRPTKYKKEYAKQALKLCELGATDIDLAEAFDVNIATIYRWKNKNKEFCDALKVEKAGYDERVKRSLAMRAVGYSHPEIDIRVIDGKIVKTEITKHYPPDTRAALAWLYNRCQGDWHPKPEEREGQDSLVDALAMLIKKMPD